MLTLDASNFGAKQLVIEDIFVDANNNVFIVDGQLGLRVFRYLQSNRIVRGPSYLAQDTYSKGAAFAKNSNSTVVLLGTSSSVKQFEYNGKSLVLKHSYELPEEDYEWEQSD